MWPEGCTFGDERLDAGRLPEPAVGGLPPDAPGMADRPTGDAWTRVGWVEEAITEAIDSPRFRPHLTLHETEAWIFTSGVAFERRFGQAGLAAEVSAMVEEAGGPELLNDGPTTARSKRLESLVPTYAKVLDGPAILGDAGLEPILEQLSARADLAGVAGDAGPTTPYDPTVPRGLQRLTI